MPERVMIILEAGSGGAPEWIHLLPLGTLELTDNRDPIQVDQESLHQVIAAWQKRGNDLVIDYEHKTLSGEEAPAAGWIKEMQARPDGLWARVDWTERAANYIKNKEYRYFSPVLPLDEARRPTALLNAGLTNFPAINHLPPLVAKCREGLAVVTLRDFNAEERKKAAREGWALPDGSFPIGNRADLENAVHDYGRAKDKPAAQKHITKRAKALGCTDLLPADWPGSTKKIGGEPMKTKLQEILQLKGEVTEAEVLSALAARLQQSDEALPVIAKALGLKDDATVVQIGEAVTALKSNTAKTTELEKEVAALKDREAIRDAEVLVDAAIKAGKYAPAERELAILDAKRDPEHFKKCVAARPQTLPFGEKLRVLKDGGGAKDGEPGPETPVDVRLAFKAQALAVEKQIDLAEAQAEVLRVNPELAREWQQSLQVARA
jgi:phage I-like protein